MNIGGLNLRQVLVQDFRHRRAGDIGAFSRETTVSEIAAGVLAIGHIDIGNDIDNPAVRFLR